MTDFSCAQRVHRMCTGRALRICCAALVACLPRNAFAGAWDAFEARCLSAMQSEQSVVSDDMTFIEDAEIWALHGMHGDGYDVRAVQYKLPSAPEICTVLALSPQAEVSLRTGFSEFEAASLENGNFDYNDVVAPLDPVTMQAVRWRSGLMTSDSADRALRVYLLELNDGTPLRISVEDLDL